MSESKKINYTSKSVPSSPGPQQITVEGQKSMKGSSEFVSKMPEKNVIPEGGKGSKGFNK